MLTRRADARIIEVLVDKRHREDKRMKSPASCSEHVPVVVTEDFRLNADGVPVARLVTVECLECAIRLDTDPYFRLELEEAA